VHKSKEPGIILKLDSEKAYDRVNLDFLFEILQTRGFSARWVGWIKNIVLGGSVGVTLNGTNNSFFKTGKGLRQGDPLSPLLYNLVGDVLTRMLAKAANRNLIKGSSTNQGREIISLQYADDTILFSSIDRPLLENLKNTLTLFEQISVMRINFHKSELIPLNLEDSQTYDIAHIFSCPVGNFPIKYHGVPLHFEKLKREDIQPLVDKIMQKISGWKGRLLSYAARVTLIQTCIASIPEYLLSFIKFPKWAIRTISSHMANCLWNDNTDRHRWHLANWESITMCKEHGGVGIVVWTSLGPLLRWVQGPTTRWAPWTTRLALHGT
jgi:hypothetical protein